MARAQEAKFFEFRSTISLSDQEQRDEAHAMLEAAHAGFTEGFETKDLSEAPRVLKQLEVISETSLPFEVMPRELPRA